MKNLTFLIKPASSLCNMRCKYCFYNDIASKRTGASAFVMDNETTINMLSCIKSELSQGDKIQFVFQGGEPTLVCIDYYKRFVSYVKEWEDIQVSYSIQTNGVLIDDDWCIFLKENNFLVGLSFDILQNCHDNIRVDSVGNGTYKRVAKTIHLLEKNNIEYNVLCTLTNSIARYPKQIWDTICKLDLDYVQFTPCINNYGYDEKSLHSLTPKRFASFYKSLFKYWFESISKGKYRSIKFFDDIVNLMAFGIPTSCGINGTCLPQLVIEADGSVYPCDFYCLDEYKLGNITSDSITSMLRSEKLGSFINRIDFRPKLCEECPFRSFCGGYCKRMRSEVCLSSNDNYCGYRDFLDNCGGMLSKIAKEQLKHLQNK